MKHRVALFGALCAATAASGVAAHAVGWSIAVEAQAVALEFNYAGDDPMAFAEVTVTAPDGRVFQTGRADREGHFAFVVPVDAPADGIWKIAAIDGEGHSIEAAVTPDSPANVAATQAVGAHIIGWVALVSVILSIGLAGALLEQRARIGKASGERPRLS